MLGDVLVFEHESYELYEYRLRTDFDFYPCASVLSVFD